MSNTDSGSVWQIRDFRRLFTAHAGSLLGTSVTAASIGLLAHDLTGGSASFVLGLALALRIAVKVGVAPLAGILADRWGERRVMIGADLLGALASFTLMTVHFIWQLFALVFLINVSATLFTPVYKAVIPRVVDRTRYPIALVWGTFAYEISNFSGPALAALVIALAGYRFNFALDALTFLLSAVMIARVSTLRTRPTLEPPSAGSHSIVDSIKESFLVFFRRPALRQSIGYSIAASIFGGFVLVATIDYVKLALQEDNVTYVLFMGAFGFGSACGALGFGKLPDVWRNRLHLIVVPGMALALISAGLLDLPWAIAASWTIGGACYSIAGIRSNQLLAENTEDKDLTRLYAAHFSLSHIGWGVTYPLAGALTSMFGFSQTALVFGITQTIPLFLLVKK